MGYTWTPYFRLTPGGTKALRSLLTWAGGPTNHDLVYEPVIVKRRTVNEKIINLVRGFRVRVTLRFAIGGNMADHATVKDIVNGLVTSTTRVELSLDNQVTYRDVELVDYDGPSPFNGKTLAGAEFRLTVETTDLISAIPAIGSGTW